MNSLDRKIRRRLTETAYITAIAGIVTAFATTVLGYQIDLNPFDAPTTGSYFTGVILTLFGASLISGAIAARQF